MYIAKDHVTNVEKSMTREEVQAAITTLFQSDMGIAIGEGMSDTEIEATVADNMEAYFETGTFDMGDYEIIRTN